MMVKNIFKNEKFRVIVFFTLLTVVLTWPSAWHFFSSVPSSGSDTMRVIGTAGDKANLLQSLGIFKGTSQLIKDSGFNITALYAYFQLIFGRIAGYNILFFLSFILSGFGAYLLAFYFTKDKPASLIAGIIFAFSPFHVHNALATNAGTLHQEWLPFFALYLFKFFDELSLKNFSLSGLFLALICFTEHQLLAFTAIFILFFLVYQLFTRPRVFLQPKFWMYSAVSAAVFLAFFFFVFHQLAANESSSNNLLNAELKAATKYSNDSISIFIPPSFHSFWPRAFSGIKKIIQGNAGNDFSIYAGYSVLILSLAGIAGVKSLRKKNIPVKGIFFWLAVAVGFYILSWGPYLHFKGALDPPLRAPYWLIYQYLPFYKNIRMVGRLFVWSMLGFSVLAAWGTTFINFQFSIFNFQKDKKDGKSENHNKNDTTNEWKLNTKSKFLYSFVGVIIILDFLAVPFKTNTLLHSSFYEKLGQDKEKYNIIEVPGSTNYDFASRDLVWQSIHQKNDINKYDFNLERGERDSIQEMPIIRTLLFDLPSGSNKNDSDIMQNSYYRNSNEIMNYYNMRYIILDKEGLKGDPSKGDPNMIYAVKNFIGSVIDCQDQYEDNFLYACKVNFDEKPDHMFLAMDFNNEHWKSEKMTRGNLRRWAENGAGLKLVNMRSDSQSGKLMMSVQVEKPLNFKIFLNGQEVYNKYLTTLGKKQEIEADLGDIKSGENAINFGLYGADGKEMYSDKKSDTIVIYDVTTS